MGFFGKKNKKNGSDDTVTTKSPEQIKGEQLNTELQNIRNEIPVSYTHLTLPTKA